MDNITYLVGAGASIEVLPLVNQIPSELLEFSKFLSSRKAIFENNEPDFAKSIDSLMTDFQWLAQVCKEHSSIDTFAKKLFIKKDTANLDKLKLLLSLFFCYRQASAVPDKRYDSFFASIIRQNTDHLPPINILSWNYDSQFELAFNGFTDYNDLYENQNKLNVVTKHAQEKAHRDGFSIFKINGITSFRNRHDNHVVNFYYDQSNKINTIQGLIHWYNQLKEYRKSGLRSNISFAWEEERENSVIEVSMNSIRNTTVLVVIGYSFPFFNRDVDKKLLNEGMPNLRKVYFQDAVPEIIRERFLSIRDNIEEKFLVCRSDVGQFLLPNELRI